MEEVKEQNAIDWSQYMAGHGAADVSIEVEEDNRTFFKKLFSGPPPKKKIGNIEELLPNLNSSDPEEALIAYKHISWAICRNEFVASASLPAFPFIMQALETAWSNSNFKLANHLIELLKGFAINLHRKALYPQGKWADQLQEKLKESLPQLKAVAEVEELKQAASELIEILEREPAHVIPLFEKIEWLPEGEIRFVNMESEEELTNALGELGFKVYVADCENIEMEMELVNAIVNSLNLAGEPLDPTAYWGWPQFVDSMINEFAGDGSDHVAILATNLSPALATMKEALLLEVENIVVSVQHRDDTIFNGPVQREFFFLCDARDLKEVFESESEKAFSYDPSNIDFYRTRAYVAMERDDFEAAIKHYSKAIELDPDDFSFYRQRAQLYRLMERYEEAVEDCTRAQKLDEGAMAYCERARSQIKLGNYQQAIDDCKTEIELSADDEVESWVPYHLIAEAYLNLEKYEDAIENASRSLKIQVTKEGYETRARAYESSSEEELARQDFERADKTNRGDPGVL